MTALNIFTKKKSAKEPSVTSQKEEKQVPKENRGKISAAISLLIKRPHPSEKAVLMHNDRQYVFVVEKAATKTTVQSAIESIYDVSVEKVRVINMPGKTKRLGVSKGWRPGYKKAIVTLKKGDKIELG